MNVTVKFLIVLAVLCSPIIGCSQDSSTEVIIRNGEKLENGSSVRFLMMEISPNPSQTKAYLSFLLNSQQHIKFRIYSQDWQEIRLVADNIYSGGMYHLSINTENLANGTYYLVATCEDETHVMPFMHIQ